MVSNNVKTTNLYFYSESFLLKGKTDFATYTLIHQIGKIVPIISQKYPKRLAQVF